MKDRCLEVKIEDEELIIRIGISTLAGAIRLSPYIDGIVMDHDGDENVVDITDEAVFADAIREAMQIEEEDGTTPIHRMFDSAAEWAIEQGCEGIEIRE